MLKLKFEKLICEMKIAEDKIKIFIRDSFPVGCEIEYIKNNTRQKGIVLSHCYGLDLRVQNIKTKSIYNISAHDIFREVI